MRVEFPRYSGNSLSLVVAADELPARLNRIFLNDSDGQNRRAVFGGNVLFQTGLHWRNYISFYEHLHGDIGAGLGANHQTG